YDLIVFFPTTIILALLLNEVRHQVYKRLVQTLVYVPHFLSWVVVVGITYILLGSEGVLNKLGGLIGLERINFLFNPDWFRPLIILQLIWKDAGWGTIIFQIGRASCRE